MQHPSKIWLLGGALLAVLGVSAARADEALRKAQQALHDQGFYYGKVDGAPGDETTQAIRRYQIRNGLAVTGLLNDETIQSIAKTGSPAKRPDEDRRYANTPGPAPTPAPRRPAIPPPPPPTINGEDDEEDDAPRPARPDLRVAPEDRVGPRIARPSLTLMSLLEGTPYEFAPPPVQVDVVRRAQLRLSRSGFFGGEPNGQPDEGTADAIGEFQAAYSLRRTGRLTPETLEALHLAPTGRGPGGFRGQRPAYEGRVVR